MNEKEKELEARRFKCDARIADFFSANEQLRRKQEEASQAASGRDPVLRDNIVHHVNELWKATVQRFREEQETTPDFARILRERAWAIQAGRNMPDSIVDLLDAWLIASWFHDSGDSRQDDAAFFTGFFAQMRYPVLSILDKYNNSFFHYLFYREEEEDYSRILFGLKALADWTSSASGLRRSATTDSLAAGENPATFRNLLNGEGNLAGENVMFLARETLSAAGNKALGEQLQAICDGQTKAVQKARPASERSLNRERLHSLLADKDYPAAIQLLRDQAELVTPEDIDQLFNEFRADAFAMDIIGADAPRQTPAHNHGALVAHFARKGIEDPAYANRRLLRKVNNQTIGRRNKNGYTSYMQIAASTSINPAFLKAEHDFMDHIFYQIARLNFARPNNNRSFQDIQFLTCRDVLDSPGQDGRTALHLAAIGGNLAVVDYILKKSMDLTAAEQYTIARNRGASDEKLQQLRNIHARTLRGNLTFLARADNDGCNAWMHAIMQNRVAILESMTGFFSAYPDYMEVISQMPCHKDEKTWSLFDFAGQHFGTGFVNDAGNYLRKVLREFNERAVARRRRKQAQVAAG